MPTKKEGNKLPQDADSQTIRNYDDKTTAEEIARDFASHAKDLRVLITGGSSGVGIAPNCYFDM